MSLGAITVALRLITRGILRRTLGWDDVTIVIALVCLTANDLGNEMLRVSGFRSCHKDPCHISVQDRIWSTRTIPATFRVI